MINGPTNPSWSNENNISELIGNSNASVDKVNIISNVVILHSRNHK